MKLVLIILISCIAVFALLSGCSGKRPDSLGVTDGSLSPCPDSPNCVSTQASDDEHTISPIPISGPTNEVMDKVAVAIESLGGTIVSTKGNYLHAEFTSRFWRFVDDLECLYVQTDSLLHVRSASRIGYSDFNVNRTRVEELESLLGQGAK